MTIARAGTCSFLPISQREVSVLFIYKQYKEYTTRAFGLKLSAGNIIAHIREQWEPKSV